MDNNEIADQLSLLGKLMEIHGDNSFKAKTYLSAAFAIEQLPNSIATLSPNKIFSLKGVGESVGKKVLEMIEDGELTALKEYLEKTPAGVLEMMNIKGLGPKKIHTIWKELGIDTVDGLQQACTENRIAEKKGFGEKTQQKILDALNFQEQNQGKLLYAQVEAFAESFTEKLREHFPDSQMQLTGEFRRQLEVICKLEWVTTAPKADLLKFLDRQDFTPVYDTESELVVNLQQRINLYFYFTNNEGLVQLLFETSSSDEFLSAFRKHHQMHSNFPHSEEEIFEQAGIAFIPPFLRESETILTKAVKGSMFSNVLQTNEVKGLIHAHSDWSDGGYSIEAMAEELISMGFEYLVISDHSKAAYYAGGLTEQRIKEQHRYVDELNRRFAPFRIFKSIECDILSDGALDYSNEVLSTFDLVIASIHSNLDMDKEKAMKRLIGAITNPYVTILGHMTGRRLLSRKAYPVDFPLVIDACAENKVVIEINANPNRLDMDWRWIDYALQKGVMLSVNPDAHTIEEFHNIRYGVLVAQKGGLTKESNLSSMNLAQFETYLNNRKQQRFR
jgi:DNA polymerase (family 10)